MVEEVRNHLKEMLESGAIRPSQSAWCNAVVPSEEKRWQLTFLYQLLMSEHTYKEGFLPIAPNTGGTGEFSGCRSLFLPGSEVWILADKNGRGIEAVYRLHCG